MTPTPKAPSEALLPATEADRRTYEAYIRQTSGVFTEEAWFSQLHAGEFDASHGVQIARLARIEALEEAAKVAEAHAAPPAVPEFAYDEACRDIATAIRDLKGNSK